jgi:dolichol kinase
VAWLVYALSPQSAATRWIFGSILFAALLGDLLRLRAEAVNRLVFRVFRALLRPREVDSPSLSWYMLGVFLVLWIPDRTAVVPALIVLAVADPVAGSVGQTWGSHRLGKGTVEGSAAFFAAAVAVLTPFVGISAALTVAAVATATEVVRTPLDDNLVIPIVTALGLWAL